MVVRLTKAAPDRAKVWGTPVTGARWTCAFVNNMPDGAFEATERQFVNLLEVGSALGLTSAATQLVSSLRARLSALSSPTHAQSTFVCQIGRTCLSLEDCCSCLPPSRLGPRRGAETLTGQRARAS